jgi:hypothetical protein
VNTSSAIAVDLSLILTTFVVLRHRALRRVPEDLSDVELKTRVVRRGQRHLVGQVVHEHIRRPARMRQGHTGVGEIVGGQGVIELVW